MSKAVDMALIGADSATGELMLELLAEQSFSLGTLFPLADEDSAGKRVDFGKESLVVQDIATFDFTQVQLAVCLAGNEVSEKYVPIAVAAGCVVVDSSEVFADDQDVPMVVPEVNPGDIANYENRRIIVSPAAATVQLLLCLKPLQDAVGIRRVSVTSYHAVSENGQAAVEELAKQTAMLLNARPVKGKVFPKQITFNVIPQVGAFEENGYTHGEMNIIRQTRRILGDEELMVSATAAWVPVFFGHSLDVQVETRDKLTAGKVGSLLRKAPGIKLSPKGGLMSYPTPVTDGAGSDNVVVGRIREDHSHPNVVHFWAVSDNIRKGVVLNCIQIVQILVKEFL